VSARRLAALLLAAAALAGCGGAGGAHGRAALWVTRDRGAEIVLDTRVDAGQTLMRALRGVAKVETRYGGRFVQGVDGIAGSRSGQRDWFWFVNGYEGDRSAAEYHLQRGDIAWFDYRSWSEEPEAPVVVGAFPEPFLHGYDGKRRVAAVRYDSPSLEGGAHAIGGLIGADTVAPSGRPVPKDANLFLLVEGPQQFRAELREPGAGPGSPVRFTFAGDAYALADDPGSVALRRYELP
jgi:hypothetical protein